jgi:hypothetical protein
MAAIDILIDGETDTKTVQWLGADGAAVPAAEISVYGEWIDTLVPAPPLPAAQIYDADTWLVIASSAGMGGHSATLRVTATRIATGEVLKFDTQVLVRR